MSFEEKIKQKALSLGFDLVGVTSAVDIEKEQITRYNEWLNAGNNGQMAYLARNPDKRFSPGSMLEGAKSVICVAINYKINQPLETDSLKIASYALYPDYHIFIKQKLQQVVDFLKTKNENVKTKICVGSSPISDKSLAVMAGLGFFGKNRLVVNPQFGSFLSLGEIITDMELESDEPEYKERCGSCTKCIQACPTGAISDDGFNAKKCISYLTTEVKGEIDEELKSKMGQHVFGCDECLAACPYNHKSPVCEKEQFSFRARKINIKADEVIGWNEKDFEVFAAGSAMQRIGLDRFKRNALICKINSENASKCKKV